MDKKKKQLIIAPIAIIVIIGLIVGFCTGLFNRNVFYAEAEAEIIPAISEVAGQVDGLNVELGQHVEKGDVLAVIDNTDQQYVVKQLEIQLEQAILAENTSSNNTGNDLLSTSSNYNSAASAAESALKDYEDAQSLFQAGAISQSELTAAKLAYTRAENARVGARSALNKANDNFATANAQENIALIQSKLEQARNTLEKYTISAECSGTIITKSYNEGNIVAPGYTIVEIAQDDNIQLLVYVPEKILKQLKYGSQVTVKYEKKEYPATVTWIDVSTSYVPQDLQTSANKSKKSFKVKLTPDDKCQVRAGETVKVYF
jgi:HlyD family secretion protein